MFFIPPVLRSSLSCLSSGVFLELFYICVANAVKALHRLGFEDYLVSMSFYLEENHKMK